MNVKQIREMLKEANRSGRNVYCLDKNEHYEFTYRVMSAFTIHGVTWVRTISYGAKTSDGLRQGFQNKFIVQHRHTFDIR